jgi:hypothetical protein
MPVFTSLWNLLKKNPATDGADTFNIQTMLNDNWDKIDAALGLKAVNADVRAATTANITLSGLQTIDGVALAAGDRVLVKNQTTGSQNGIYTAAEGPWTRATDADVSGKLASGLLVYVKEGSSNGKKQWRLSNTGPITLGTTALTFELVAGAGSATDAVIGNRTITDTTAPAGDSGTLTSLFGWLGYMIKAITGKSSWRTAPATTLEAAKAHMDATAVHGATSSAVADRIPIRNADGTFSVGVPTLGSHVARLDTITQFGLGATSCPILADANLSPTSPTSFYTCKVGTTLNTPADVSADGSLLHIAREGRPSQIFFHYNSNRAFMRGYTTSGWQQWTEIETTAGSDAKVSAVQSNLAAHIGSGGTAHAVATASAAGFMSAADKAKLDGITAGATAGTATPLMDGTAAVGTSTAYAREDHRHPTDTTRAPLASPAFTGTPTAPTAAAGTNNTQIATTAFVQNAINDVKSTSLGYGTTTGTGTAYTLTLNPAPTALVSGMRVTIKVHTANTGAATLNVNGLGAKSIKKANGNDVAAGNLKASGVYTLVYDGTNFILQGEGGEYGTATAADVLAGKTIGTENGLVTGTMPNKTGATTAWCGYETVKVQVHPQDSTQGLVTVPNAYNAPGYYDSSSSVTANVANLNPSNIKAGVAVGRFNGDSSNSIVGTFTSDANAAAGDILSGKTAYVNGQKITGNMPNLTGIRNATGTARWPNGDLAVYPERGYQKGGAGDGEIRVTTAQLQAACGDLAPQYIVSGANIYGVAGTAVTRKFASGTATSSSSTLNFDTIDGNFVSSMCYVQVSGIGFKPTAIFLFETGTYPHYASIYSENGDGTYSDYVMHFIYYYNWLNTTAYVLKANSRDGYVSSGGFRLPAGSNPNRTFKWYALA